MKVRIAAVITARNEQNFLDKTLTALFEQYVQPSKVIVVNYGSTDKRFYMLKGYISNDVGMYDHELRLYLSTIQHKRIKRYIRNLIKAFVAKPA